MPHWRVLKWQLSATDCEASDDLAMALQLALMLGRPLLLEEAARVGKTQVTRTLATLKSTRLIHPQCYEGLDASDTIYEWTYQRLLLAIRAAAESGERGAQVEQRIFRTLPTAALPKAIRQPTAPVLLIEEIDRADEEFEAYLLEILSAYQITCSELGPHHGNRHTHRHPHIKQNPRSFRRVTPPLHLHRCR